MAKAKYNPKGRKKLKGKQQKYIPHIEKMRKILGDYGAVYVAAITACMCEERDKSKEYRTADGIFELCQGAGFTNKMEVISILAQLVEDGELSFDGKKYDYIRKNNG